MPEVYKPLTHCLIISLCNLLGSIYLWYTNYKLTVSPFHFNVINMFRKNFTNMFRKMVVREGNVMTNNKQIIYDAVVSYDIM